MAEPVTLWGLHPEAVALCWSLRKRGVDATLVYDGGDLLAGFGGATQTASPNDVRTMLAELDSDLLVGDARVVSSFGIVREVNVAHRSVLRLQPGKNVRVLSFIGWREWSAATIADGLKQAGVAAEPVNLQLHGSPQDASFSQIERRMADVMFRSEVVRALAGAESILFPPVLGTTSTGVSVLEALASELGLPASAIGVGVATTPSPLGQQHLQHVENALPILRDPVVEKAADTLLVAGRRGQVLAYGPRARARVAAWDATTPIPLTNVMAIDAARSLGDAWTAGLERGARWPQ